MKQWNPNNSTFPIALPPQRWNPEDARNLTKDDLRLAPAVEDQLSELDLSVDNLLTVLRNSPWQVLRYYYLFTFAEVSDPNDPGLAAARNEGLDDVSILVERARPRVVGVMRGPLPQRPRRRAGMPPFPAAATFAKRMPRLTQHARERLSERCLTRDDAHLIMKYGRWVLVDGHLHCAITGRRRRSVSAQEWKRLQGARVIMCPFSNEVITVWWDRSHPKEALRGSSGPARKPRYERRRRRDWMKLQ